MSGNGNINISETLNNIMIEHDNSKKQITELTEKITELTNQLNLQKNELDECKKENDQLKNDQLTPEVKDSTPEQILSNDPQFLKYKKQIIENHKLDENFDTWYKSKNVLIRDAICGFFIKIIMNGPKIPSSLRKINYLQYTLFYNNKIRLYDNEHASISKFKYENPIYDVPPEFLKFMSPHDMESHADSFSSCLIFIEIIDGSIYVNFVTQQNHSFIKISKDIFENQKKINDFIALYDATISHNKNTLKLYNDDFSRFNHAYTTVFNSIKQ